MNTLSEVGQVGDLLDEELDAAFCILLRQVIPRLTGALEAFVRKQ